MTKMKAIDEIRNKAVRLYEGMVVVRPQLFAQTYISLKDVNPAEKDRVYAINNSTIVFSYNEGIFVMPYTRTTVEILKGAGLKEDYLMVPFSNWDYPMYEKTKWELLRVKARETCKQEFAEDCKQYCDERGFGELSNDVLDNCFEIPRTGMKVKNVFYESTCYPLADMEVMNWISIRYIGKYSYNNGKVVFIYRNGKTYVAKGYGILEKLKKAGYKEDFLYVPLSNGEEIMDEVLRTKWEAMKKFE